MKKTHYLSLLYLLGIAPIVRILSTSTSSNPIFSFGLFNIIGLSIYTLIFSSLSNRKKSGGLAIIGIALIIGVGVFGLSKVGQSVSNRLYNKALAPMPGDTTLSNTGDSVSQTGDLLSGTTTLSGDQIDDLDTNSEDDIDDESHANDLKTNDDSETAQDDETPDTPDNFTNLADDALLNYGQIIPYLVDTYNLTKSGTRSYNFGNLSAGSPLQTPFEIAASHAMIGTSTNPDTTTSCDTYLVLKGIAAGRDVGPYSGTPQVAYRNHAQEIGQVNNCLDGQFVTKATL